MHNVRLSDGWDNLLSHASLEEVAKKSLNHLDMRGQFLPDLISIEDLTILHNYHVFQQQPVHGQMSRQQCSGVSIHLLSCTCTAKSKSHHRLLRTPPVREQSCTHKSGSQKFRWYL